MTYGGHEQFLDLVDGALQFDFGAVLRVLDGDEHVQLVVQVLPVGFAAILLLLEPAPPTRRGHAHAETR